METFETFDDTLSNINHVEQEAIDASLVYALDSGRHRALVNNNSSFCHTLKEDELDFNFTQPIYANKIRLYTSVITSKLKIVYKNLETNNDTYINGIQKDGYIEFVVNDMIKCFVVKPVRRATLINFLQIKIEKLECIGFELSELGRIASSIKKYDSLRSEVSKYIEDEQERLEERSRNLDKKEEELNAKITSHEEEVDARNEEIEELQTSINEFSTTKAEVSSSLESLKKEELALSDKVSNAKSKHEDLLSKNKAIEDAIERNNQINSQLNKDISENEAKLRELLANKNLFSEVLSSYNDRANIDIKEEEKWQNIWGGLLGGLVVICFGYFGYVSLYEPIYGWEKILTNRLPFSLLAFGAIEVLYSLFRGNQSKIREIKKRQSDLHAIGIIVKESSDTIVKELNISNEDKYNFSFKAKMEMIKSYLVNIGVEYKIN